PGPRTGASRADARAEHPVSAAGVERAPHSERPARTNAGTSVAPPHGAARPAPRVIHGGPGSNGAHHDPRRGTEQHPRGARAAAHTPAVRPLVSLHILVPSLAVALLCVAVLGAAVITERNSRS